MSAAEVPAHARLGTTLAAAVQNKLIGNIDYNSVSHMLEEETEISGTRGPGLLQSGV